MIDKGIKAGKRVERERGKKDECKNSKVSSWGSLKMLDANELKQEFHNDKKGRFLLRKYFRRLLIIFLIFKRRMLRITTFVF